MDFTGKKFSMIISGSPGVGKTTLALSAPNPVLIDFDDGVSRVKAQHRTPTIVCATYEEVLEDLNSPEIKEFETIVIDTGGSLITFMSGWAIRKDAQNGQRNGALSQRGYGAIKKEFQRLTEYLKYTLRKNIIYIFHTVEEKDNDVVKHRLLCEGSARNIVWQPCDIGCFVYMLNGDRVAGFSPTESYFAKGTHGVNGTFTLPNLDAADANNEFLTKLFGGMKTTIAEESKVFAQIKESYNKAMESGTSLVKELTTVEAANSFAQALDGIAHALTSKKEIAAMGRAKVAELGYKWDKDAKQYVDPNAAAPEDPEEDAPAEESEDKEPGELPNNEPKEPPAKPARSKAKKKGESVNG
jgi:hypothetical protein